MDFNLKTSNRHVIQTFARRIFLPFGCWACSRESVVILTLNYIIFFILIIVFIGNNVLNVYSDGFEVKTFYKYLWYNHLILKKHK